MTNKKSLTSTELLQIMPITLLGLRSGISKRMMLSGIHTLHDLLNTDLDVLAQTIEGMGKTNYDLLTKTVSNLKSRDWSTDEVAKFQFLEGIRVIPSSISFNEQTDHINFPGIFTQVVSEILHTKDDRLYTIIKHRYGLDDESTYTLEQLGSAYQITRERVRQMEEKGITTFRQFLLTGKLGDKDEIRVNDLIRIEANKLKNEIETHYAIITLVELLSILKTMYGTDLKRPYIDLLLEIFDFKPLLNISVDHYPTWIIN